MRAKRKLHTLKIEQKWYREVLSEEKKAEFRINDRDYQAGDLIHFTDTNGEEYDDMFNLFVITHILPIREVKIGESKLDDYVILSINKVKTNITLYNEVRI